MKIFMMISLMSVCLMQNSFAADMINAVVADDCEAVEQLVISGVDVKEHASKALFAARSATMVNLLARSRIYIGLQLAFKDRYFIGGTALHNTFSRGKGISLETVHALSHIIDPNALKEGSQETVLQFYAYPSCADSSLDDRALVVMAAGGDIRCASEGQKTPIDRLSEKGGDWDKVSRKARAFEALLPAAYAQRREAVRPEVEAVLGNQNLTNIVVDSYLEKNDLPFNTVEDLISKAK
jgi:hypothetical protein